MIRRRINALFNPEVYHGWGRTKSYFEGWYFKLVSKDRKNAFAFIPGIAMDENGKGHSFIQFLDGTNKTAEYFKFDQNDFKIQPYEFDLKIQKNEFSLNHLKIDIENIQVDVKLSHQHPWPSQWYSPGIMGPFSFVPFMQCYHGIVSMDHELTGFITIGDKKIDMTGGRGYMEKDWGSSFPSGYVWMQSNHFKEERISLKSSVARIPWLFSSFNGYIAGVLLYDRIIQFTTYNFTKLQKCNITSSGVHLIYENRQHHLEIEAIRDEATTLIAPIKGFMEGRIEESMTAQINVQLKDKKNKTILLEDSGKNAGLEVAGDVEILMK